MHYDIIEWYYNKFYFISRFFSDNYKKNLSKDLFQAGMSFDATEYVAFCFGIAFTAALFSLVSFLFAPQYAVGIVLFTFSVSYLLCSRYPSKKKKSIACGIEKDVPIALRTIALELSIGIPFEKCLEDIASSNYGLLSPDFKKVVNEIKSGASIPEALEQFAERTDSVLVKKSVSQLINVYQKGGKKKAAFTLKKIADEENSVMRTRLKEYNGKLMLYSLIFIACSAIIPAFFQVFVIIGSSFLSMPITAEQALIIPALLFPLVNLAILMTIRAKRP